ncbi:MAG TPA: hypothetical protein VMM93_06065 [Vicinamibacterales bacterium]|nr:hypothetical protein [Vicinamibacterales bacterium]
MADLAMLVLRVVHISLGVFWAGSALMVAGFLEPTVRALGPDGGRFMQHLVQQQQFTRYMTIASALTVLTGLAFLGHGMSSQLWRASAYGQAMMFGSLTGVVALGLGHGMSAPAARRLGVLMAGIQASGRAPGADEQQQMRQLQNRLRAGGRYSAVFITLTVIAMAAARHL